MVFDNERWVDLKLAFERDLNGQMSYSTVSDSFSERSVNALQYKCQNHVMNAKTECKQSVTMHLLVPRTQFRFQK